MLRRDVLKTIGLAAGSIALGREALAAGDDLSVAITLEGKTLIFSAAAGKDLGDYRSPRFVQRCIRTDHPDSALSVFFRPDRDSDRIEIVVELGRMWGKANENAKHLGAYRAVIRKGSREVATVNVPRHWWFSRWRWQSAPRPIIVKGEDLIKAKLVPPYAASAAVAADAPEAAAKAVYKQPMDSAGLQVGVGSTGERNEIGPVTEFQADYLITGRDSSLAALRAQAEAAASMPMHVRDEQTHAPVDFFKYPKLDWYYEDSGKPWVKGSEAIRDGKGDITCEWSLSASHDPALNYVPFLLTGDPYHLEELQFQGNRTLGATNYHRSGSGLQIVYPGQTRSFAWSMRTMFQLAAVTPEQTPSWLKPRAYWRRIVSDNLTWFTKTYVNNPSPACSVFAAATRLDEVAPWQEEFLAFCLGWGVMLGFEDWRKAFRWKLNSTLARTNGKSGWPRQWCTPYFMEIAKVEPSDSLHAEGSPPDIWLTSWKDAWARYRSDPNSKVTEPFPDTTSWAQDSSRHYLLYTRGVLALATQLGVTEAREPFAFVNAMAKDKSMDYKWAVASA